MTDFPSYQTFHSACFGHTAYAWQKRLAAQVAEGYTPDILEVPTGLGKSTVIPILIWGLARQVALGQPRTLPQRIVHAVDRRQVVDESRTRQQQVIAALAQQDSLKPVREALSHLAGPWKDLLVAHHIHGSAVDTGQWLRPTGCVTLSMTTLQLVSRLLHRGLGVSPRTRSISAGLLGVDAMLIVDEPQLSHQAISTIRAVIRHQEQASSHLGVPDTRLMLLGATVPSSLRTGLTAWPLTEDEREEPAVQQRLTAAKPFTLTPISATESALIDAILKQVKAWSDRPAARTGIFVNSVNVALQIHSKLAVSGLVSTVVTSRMRPTDRQIADIHNSQIVISTQSLEVGPDITFDQLITETAPLASLVQRAGRFNRDGAAANPRGVIFTSKDGKARKASEAIYSAEALASTEAFLKKHEADGIVDFSLNMQASWEPTEVSACEVTPPRLATFHSGYLGTMAHTYPTPYSDLPLEALMSGPDLEEPMDVLVAWRETPNLVDETPLMAPELVAVPITAIRAFLTASPQPVISDMASSAAAPVHLKSNEPKLPALFKRDESWHELTSVNELSPGDEIILPLDAGGYRAGVGWDPNSTEAVADHSGIAALTLREVPARSHRRFPLTPSTLATMSSHPAWEWDRFTAEEASEVIEVLLHHILDEDCLGADLQSVAVELGLPGWDISATEATPDILMASWPLPQEKGKRSGGPVVLLRQHQLQVAATVQHVADRAGITGMAAKSSVRAAARHDDGKATDVFQQFLGAPQSLGNSLGSAEPWAKSIKSRSRLEQIRIAKAVGHSLSWRHEGLSAALAATDREDPLTIHLVGSHHGRFRPWLNSRSTGQGQEELTGRADSFDDLNKEWGPWGLSYLEAVVRLSDWYSSANPHDVSMDLPPAVVQPLPSAVPTTSETELKGIIPTPMTGWFAVAGLLAIAHTMGDHSARAWWPASHTPGASAPIFRSALPLEDLVSDALSCDQWNALETHGKSLAGGIAKKNQKVGPPSTVSEALRRADDEAAWLVTALLNDSVRAEDTGLPLSIPAIANNSDYVGVALSQLKLPNTVFASLLNPLEGWSAEHKCSGGMDQPPPDGGIRGRESFGRHPVRSALAPLALLGMAALGNGGANGPTVRDRTCRLPVPAYPVDLAALAALVRGTSDPNTPYLEYTERGSTKSRLDWRLKLNKKQRSGSY